MSRHPQPHISGEYPTAVAMAPGPSSPKRTPLTVMTSPPSTEPTQRTGRTRSASVLKVEEVGATSQEEYLDQSAYMNMNVEWVNQKGAYT